MKHHVFFSALIFMCGLYKCFHVLASLIFMYVEGFVSSL